MADNVNHPAHYTYGDIEIIDIIEMITNQYPSKLSYSIGNNIKYVARAPHKNGIEDLKKARWCLDRAIQKWEAE